jgi:putative cell wall-binding protein
MDQKQQKQINEAAEKFAGAVKDSYEAMTNRAMNAHEMNAQLTQAFFNSVQSNLQAQAEGNQALAQDLIEHQKKQQEASREMIQQSMNAYTDFLNSMFAYQQRNLDRAKQDTKR